MRRASKVTPRMRTAPRTLFAALIFALGLSLSACGSSSRLLSGQEAGTLTAALQQVQAALGQHNCDTAQADAIALRARIDGLPSSVNATARASLAQGATRVQSLVAKECPRQAPATTAPQTTTQAPPTTTATTPPPPKPKPKPKPPKPKPKPPKPATTPTQTGTTTGPPQGNGNGNGNGHGHGNGNGHGGGQGGDGGGQGGGDPTTPTSPTTTTTTTSTTPTNPSGP